MREEHIYYFYFYYKSQYYYNIIRYINLFEIIFTLRDSGVIRI